MPPPASNLQPLPKRVVVYIDGLNLFHSVLKGSQNKWLDLARLMRALRNRDDVVAVKYFTALIRGADQAKQQAYLNALEASDPALALILGHFQDEKETCRVPGPHCASAMRDYYRSREKQTDVGIAVEMVHDAHTDLFDLAVLVSGDSDLVPAVKKVCEVKKTVIALADGAVTEIHKEVLVYVPFLGNKLGSYANELRQAAAASAGYSHLPHSLFPKMQLPSPIPTKSGQVTKPAGW